MQLIVTMIIAALMLGVVIYAGSFLYAYQKVLRAQRTQTAARPTPRAAPLFLPAPPRDRPAPPPGPVYEDLIDAAEKAVDILATESLERAVTDAEDLALLDALRQFVQRRTPPFR